MITKQQADEVEKIVREILDQRFNGQFVFDPIVVRNAVDRDGLDYTRLYIVYDGDRKRLDPGWTAGFAGRIMPKSTELGIDEFPIKSFVDRAGWDAVQEGRYFQRDPYVRGYRHIEPEASV